MSRDAGSGAGPPHAAGARAAAPLDRDTIDVLVVGGGAVGLTSALLLARHGCRPVVVERHAGTAIHPRARGLNVRTMEIFRELGLERAIRAAGAAIAGNHLLLWVETLAGRELRRAPAGSLAERDEIAARSPTGWASCAQDELEPVLLAAAREAGAEVRFSTELVALTQDEAGVTATLQSRVTGDRQRVRARYVVGADGSRSPLRQALGVTSEGPGLLTSNLGIYFRAQIDAARAGRDFILCFVDNPAVRGVLLAVDNAERWVFNAPFTTSAAVHADSFTPERCVALVRAALGLPELAVELLSVLPWDASAGVARQFQVGRVFFAGDAAHTMPPAGAFGLNTGVADAHNLAWKLAAVTSGTAGPGLLTSYESERRPVAVATVAHAVAAGRRRFAPVTPAGGDAGQSEDVQVNDLTLMLGAWYQSSAVLGGDEAFSLSALARRGLALDGRPGTRAPHLWIERAGARTSSLDLLGRGWVLFASDAAWAVAGRALARARGLALAVHSTGGAEADAWAAALGVGPHGATLVRPDGVVAWRAVDRVDEPGAALADVFAALLGDPAARSVAAE